MTLPGLAQDDPKVIFTRALDQMMTDQMELSMDIETTDDKGRTREKAYDILMAKFGEVEKTRMLMQKPERAKGITVVITNTPGETGVIEVLTPANGKIRKMKATPENMDQVGSNLILSSLTSLVREGLSYGLEGMQEVDGKNCYSLHVNDHSDSKGMNGKFLVEEGSYHLVRIQLFDDKGTSTSITKLSDFQTIAGAKGKIQAMQIDTENMEDNSQTRMQVTHIAHRPDLKEEDFVIQEAGN
ncbi:MAG: outer membrane lipoprotein-sorting protein [Bacteroidota bacterium]|nr:outer membrane lipoprotein-sorting protein [Bacteroidota bacterium]